MNSIRPRIREPPFCPKNGQKMMKYKEANNLTKRRKEMKSN